MGRSLGSLGAMFGGLGDRHEGRGSPARPSGEGIARERARLCKMGRGSECGCGWCSKRSWGRGRATWPGIPASVRDCARAGPRRVAGKAELTGGSHGAARENGHATKRFSELTRRAREAERQKGARARATGADRGAPQGRGRGGGGARGEKLPLTGGAHLSGGAGARAAPLG